MRCVIAGSRTIKDYDLILEAFTKCDWCDKITEIVSGTANGVDILGERLAFDKDLKCSRFPADWNKHGKKAGHMRNAVMANYTDIAIIVWDGKSKGTLNMIKCMEKLGKPYLFFVVRHGELHEPN
jgi:hypothetical protein